jgi:DNA-binding MarR family transcriptional regulator
MKNKNTQSTHDNLLNQLGDTFFSMAKNMKLQGGNELTCLTPALDKLVLIIGSQGEVNIKHMSTMLSITPGAVTQQITALEKEGAISRVINDMDRREIIVRLTAHGEDLFKTIKVNHLRLLENMFSGLDDNDLKTLVDLITKASNKHSGGETSI